MAWTLATVRAQLNKWTTRLHPRRDGAVTLGNALCGTTAVGTIILSGITDGSRKVYEVPHDTLYSATDGACTATATFIGSLPIPAFSAAEGYRVLLCLENLTGTGFRVEVLRESAEYVYAVDTGGASEAGDAAETLTWTRTGFALPGSTG